MTILTYIGVREFGRLGALTKLDAICEFCKNGVI